MTKSQNTKNERNADVSKTLTEQWKKIELPDGEDYYIKWKDSKVFTATFVDFMGRKMFQRMELEFEELPIEHYLSVLAPVPSYEEWQAKLEENAQLKELLKECKGIFDECFSPSVKYGELYKQIDEVLK